MPLANGKHEAVAQAYMADRERVGWRAYRSIYPKSSQHTAESAWSALMKKPEFSARIAELAEAAAQDAVMTAQEVLQELSAIARANMADYMRAGAGGDPVLNFSALTRGQAAALIEVTVEDFLDGRGEDAREVRRTRFKLASKIDALQLLGKHYRLFVERHEHALAGSVAERPAAALARVEGRTSGAADEGRPAGPKRKAARKGKRSRTR
jgi:phage terminase small subunit